MQETRIEVVFLLHAIIQKYLTYLAVIVRVCPNFVTSYFECLEGMVYHVTQVM